MTPDSPLFRFQLWRASLPPGLRLLLTINIASYLAFVVLGLLALFGAPILETVVRLLSLPADPAAALRVPWTPLTYGFTNAFGGFFGLISFAFGAYWLNWMGRDYEESHGSHQLVGLYILGALGGALVGLALSTILPSPRGYFFGLWTPVTAILCAVATLHPNRGVGLFLLGVVPMKWIAAGFVILSLAFSADLTVLGAALAGVLFARAQQAGRDPAFWARPLFAPRRPKREKKAARSAPAKTAGRARAAAPLEVDAILDKILEKGYDSLTADERKALDEASRD